MPKISFLWDEEKTRSLFRTHLILFTFGGIVASIYTLILPASTPYHLEIVAIPLLFTLSCLIYFVLLNRPNPGIRFLIFALEGQLAASFFMALTGGFLGIVQFAPYMFLLFALFELGSDATVILGVFATVSFIGILIWTLLVHSQPNTLQEFFYFVGSYVLILIVERNIGRELSLQFEAKKRLEQIDDLKNQFITLTSHYLRTPVTVIKNLSYVEKNAALQTSAKQLEQVVEKLLTLSDIEKGRSKITPMFGDLDRLIENIISDFQSMANLHKVTITYQTKLASLQMSFDPTKLRQALSSIVDNAIKYNRLEGAVIISLSEDGKKAYVSITDTGLGIKKDQLDDLFTTFNRGSMENSLQFDRPGLGLSLYLAKLIIDAHGGTIKVESKEGVGSTFTVVLPKSPQLPS